MPINRTYSFDIDTKKYLNRVNTFRGLNGLSNIAVADAVDIDNFVVGLKDLGAWNNAVYWSLRSRHNAGSGNTVLSLGGQGTFNGTLVNSPSWGDNGILFATSGTNWMSFPSRTLSYPYSFSAAVINGATADASPALVGTACGQLELALNRFELIISIICVPIGTSGIYTQFSGWNTPNQAVLMNSRVTGNTSMFVSANGGAETALTPLNGNFNTAPVSRLWSRRGLETTRIAFALVTSGSNISNTSLYSLYRTTIGKGLGLV